MTISARFKPIAFHAIQWTGHNEEEIFNAVNYDGRFGFSDRTLWLDNCIVSVGDYVIIDMDGEKQYSILSFGDYQTKCESLD